MARHFSAQCRELDLLLTAGRGRRREGGRARVRSRWRLSALRRVWERIAGASLRRPRRLSHGAAPGGDLVRSAPVLKVPWRGRHRLHHHLHRVGHQCRRRSTFPERMFGRLAGGNLHRLRDETDFVDRHRLALRGDRERAGRHTGLTLLGTDLCAWRLRIELHAHHLRHWRLRRQPVGHGGATCKCSAQCGDRSDNDSDP
jgi:hypothetical protein